MQQSRWNTIGLIVYLVAWAVPGCQTPFVSAGGAPSAGNGQPDYETWLSRSSSGQVPIRPQGETSAVQPASANLPAGMPAGDSSVQKLGTSVADAEKSKNPKKDNEEEDGFDWSVLDPANMWKKLQSATGNGPDEKLAESLYREGMNLYREKKYADAAKKFAEAANRWPDSVLEEDALFYQAESYFFDDQYSKAHDTYGILFKKHDNSRYLDTASSRQFAIGRYWEQSHRAEPHWPVTPNFTDKTRPWFDTPGNALNAYLSVRLNDPTGPLADDALMATANYYFENGRYEDAAIHYDIIRKEYPKSDYQKESHLLSLQSKLRAYQGPYYEGKPLTEADDIARQTVRQFRGQLGTEQSRVLKTMDDIRNQKAERIYAQGQFYEMKRLYGSARLCYQEVLKDYPDTQFATQAKERIEATKDLPDKPPNHFKWLTDTFDKIK